VKIDAGLLRLLASLRVAVSGNGDQKGDFPLRQALLAEPSGNLDSVHSWHGEVEKDDVGAVGLDPLERCKAIMNHGSLKTPEAE
jgi:hypothetical protein